MVSKNQTKLITRLGKKKYRNASGLFVVEGVKSIQEFLNSPYVLDRLFTTDAALFDAVPASQLTAVTPSELKTLSFLSTPNTALALFKIPPPQPLATQGLVVALDGVNDPGNLGTIIRLCDWFDVSQLVCSPDTVDCYNPKVVQASMGSLPRVPIAYMDLPTFLSEQSAGPVYGTFMDGTSVYQTHLEAPGVLVLGNEANGIGQAVARLVDQKLTIPQFGAVQATESLNVATATAIFLSEFKRPTER